MPDIGNTMVDDFTIVYLIVEVNIGYGINALTSLSSTVISARFECISIASVGNLEPDGTLYT